MKQLLTYRFFLAFICFALAHQARAQPTSATCTLLLRGVVVEADEGDFIAEAYVRLRETGQVTLTDEKGQFSFANICKGNYTIEIQHIECKHFSQSIRFDANADLKFTLKHDPKLLESVTIQARKIDLQVAQAQTELRQQDLEATQNRPLGEVLAKIQGVNVLKTGANVVKPMLQGMIGDRLPILWNGVRQFSQGWGLDHAPEIDPFAVETASVIVGANSVRYGSGAIGGVVLLEPRAFRDSVGLNGATNITTFTNGRGATMAAFLEGKTAKSNLSWRVQASAKKQGSLHAPNYFLQNTGVEELNISAALRYRRFELFYSRFYTKIGILKDAHIGNVTDLMRAIERGRPLTEGVFSEDILRPAQQVSHDFVKLRHTLRTGEWGRLVTTASFQYNYRREYDAHRPGGVVLSDFSRAEIGFQMPSATLRSEWEHPNKKNWQGSVGIEGNYQLNNTFSGSLLPDFQTWEVGAFAVERWRKAGGHFEFELGGRFDNRQVLVNDSRRNLAKTFNFNGLSITSGLIWHLGKASRFTLHGGSAWRAPNVNELLSDGVHHGTASFERGTLGLRPEKAFNLVASLDVVEQKDWQLQIKIYQNSIVDYIMLQPDTTYNPILQTRGVVTTIRGTFPAFQYQQTNAILRGGDLAFTWRPFYEIQKIFSWQLKGSLLRGQDLANGGYLPFLPADRLENTLQFDFEQIGNFYKNYINISALAVNRQTRVPTYTTSDGTTHTHDFAAPPVGYLLWNLGVSTTFFMAKKPLQVSLNITNILNTSYRDYLDRLRYFADAMGRNTNISIKYSF